MSAETISSQLSSPNLPLPMNWMRATVFKMEPSGSGSAPVNPQACRVSRFWFIREMMRSYPLGISCNKEIYCIYTYCIIYVYICIYIIMLLLSYCNYRIYIYSYCMYMYFRRLIDATVSQQRPSSWILLTLGHHAQPKTGARYICIYIVQYIFKKT